MPTVNVELLDTRVTEKQKQELAEGLTRVVSETLGNPAETVSIVFRSVSKRNIARAGKFEL